VIVIVEGADGSGKTTLCKALHAALDVPIYKPTRTPMDGTLTVRESQAADWAAIHMAQVLIDSTGTDLILDRSFPSEWVYGQVYGRTIDDMQVQNLDSIVADRGFGVLLRYDDPEVAFSRADAHIATMTRMLQLMRAYDEYVDRSSMSWLVLDATESITTNVDWVVRTMKMPP
jgi:thymidylate kinase